MCLFGTGDYLACGIAACRIHLNKIVAYSKMTYRPQTTSNATPLNILLLTY